MADDTAPPVRAARRRLVRTREDRMVAGVAGGLGRHLGVDPILVRIGFVVLTFSGGVGLLVYAALWVATPVTDEDAPPIDRRPTLQQAVALAFITLGVLLILRRLGLWFGDALVIPVVVAAAGSAVVWTRGDDEERRTSADRFAHIRGPRATLARAVAGPVSPARIVIGTTLVGVAIAGFLVGNDALYALRQLGLAVAAALVGATLLLGPWLAKVIDELGHERRERVRQEERAELAAHLHDSVLQTLALIQRSSDDPRRIATLARVQERELRSWLYGSGAAPGRPDPTLTAAVESVAAEVEALHHLAVDVVVVGDAPVDDAARALLGAIREAATNAAKHADTDEVAVYVEVEDDEVVAFVRDRGRGFDPDRVLAEVADDHRRGLTDSVLGRIRRHDGRVELWSAPGEGTEVELAVPRARTGDAPRPTDPVPAPPPTDPAPPPTDPVPAPPAAPVPPPAPPTSPPTAAAPSAPPPPEVRP